jgi:hypothetical protein
VSGVLTAVDMNHFAGDERRTLQVKNRIDDIPDLTHAADRMHPIEEFMGLRGVHRNLDECFRWKPRSTGSWSLAASTAKR